MSKKINVEELPDFDLAEHLKTDEDIATYLSVVLEDDDSSELMHALGVVARARGMTEVARAAGLTREALYKALRPNSQPRFDTIARVCRALGLKLTAQVHASWLMQRSRNSVSASAIRAVLAGSVDKFGGPEVSLPIQPASLGDG
ncbi:addiction module antidote protein [Rhodoferax sp.]|uniref:addiction module antidote protein n=1 Tax=Rhodoferax sp. TaxID=50421 RepID=UPI00351D0237